MPRKQFWLWLCEEVGEKAVLKKKNKVKGFILPDLTTIIKPLLSRQCGISIRIGTEISRPK